MNDRLSNSRSVVKGLADRWQELERDKSAHETAISEINQNLNKLRTETIPAVFDELQQKEVTLDDGRKISIATDVNLGIPSLAAIEKADGGEKAFLEMRRENCYKWLKKNGGATIVKRSLTIFFGKGIPIPKALMALLKKMDVDYVEEEGVHPQTLNAWGREQLANGRKLPSEDDGFTVYIGPRAKMKEKRING